MQYGTKRDHKKIDIYAKTPNGPKYLCSTTWAKNCKEAREKYIAAQDRVKPKTYYALSDIYARYSA